MKKLLLVLVIAAVLIVSVLYFHKRTNPFSNSQTPEATPETTTNSPLANSQKTTTTPPSAAPNTGLSTDLASRAASPNSLVNSTTETNESANLPPLTVLDKARVVIHNYNAAFGENPVGTNPEITAALMGKNPKKINFLSDSGMRVNEKGEMVDAYGTPFFFHQISGQEMEIRSAGQDRIMWTFDDLVTK